jgi:hypothetical protein
MTEADDSAADNGSDDKSEQCQNVVDEGNACHSGEREADEQDIAGHVPREDVIESEITVGVNHARRHREQQQARGVAVLYRYLNHRSKG